MSASKQMTLLIPALAVLVLGGPLACDSSPTQRPTTDAKSFSDGVGHPDGQGGGLKLTGKITDTAGHAVESAKIVLGTAEGFSGSDGTYTLDNPPTGPGKVSVTHDWFKEKKDVAVTVKASGSTTLDIAVEAWPLKLDAADKTLADTYNKTFDWTHDKLAIAILPSPTRKNLDNAVYYHNPALYRDTSSETAVDSKLTLTTLKDHFVTANGSQKGTNVLDLTTVKDAIGGTPVTAAEQTDFMLFRPLLNWLTTWDETTKKIEDISAAKSAVAEQTWGSNAVRPQRIEKVFLHQDALWVQIVFEPFVKVGADITDSDGDGYKEIFGKLDPKLYASDLVNALKTQYMGVKFDTNGMSKEVNNALNELYSVTAAEVLRYIGRSYDLGSSKGTIVYPLVVLKHSATSTPVFQVLLAGP
ncbi:MAG: carboxypeptidase regulatory-like domain-containing protein [Deltaproteobacteria bacterium]|nr:carboxypeptidase regulatory-like domain-containing protein [Deltaproteobacteria bacterium]